MPWILPEKSAAATFLTAFIMFIATPLGGVPATEAALLVGKSIMPMGLGTTWQYVDSQGVKTGEKVIAASPTTVSVRHTGPHPFVVRWKRVKGGWSTSNLAGLGMAAGPAGNVKIRIGKIGGIALPATALWKTGLHWAYWCNSTMQTAAGGLAITSHFKTTLHCMIKQRRKLTVPAGTFNCFEVHYTGITNGYEEFNNTRIPLHVKFYFTQYYAPGVGLVESAAPHGQKLKLVRFTRGTR